MKDPFIVNPLKPARRVWCVASLVTAFLCPSVPARAQIDFEPVAYYPTVTRVVDLRIAPMDQDRFTDVIAIEWLGQLTYFTGVGDGTLIKTTTYDMIGDDPTAIDCADLDGDTLWDLVCVADMAREAHAIYQRIPLSESQVVNYEYNFIFVDANDVLLADFTGDGLPEMVAVTGNEDNWHVTADLVVLTNADGALGDPVQYGMRYNYSPDLKAVDIDNDGDLDLLALCSRTDFWYRLYVYYCEVSVFLNDGTGRLEESTTPIILPYGEGDERVPTRMAVGDIDNDGDLDLAVAIRDTEWGDELPYVMTLINIGSHGRFEYGQTIPMHTWGYGLNLSDLDGDGDLDMVVDGYALNESDVCIYENVGGGLFQWALEIDDKDLWYTRALDVRDMNADGLPDIVLGGESGLVVLLNRSDWHGPSLSHSAFVRGADSELRVESVQPDEAVYFFSSLAEPRILSGVPLLGGLVADLSEPVTLLGMSRADAQGTARLSVHIPAKAPTSVIYTQAFVRRGEEGERSVKTPCLMGRIH